MPKPYDSHQPTLHLPLSKLWRKFHSFSWDRLQSTLPRSPWRRPRIQQLNWKYGWENIGSPFLPEFHHDLCFLLNSTMMLEMECSPDWAPTLTFHFGLRLCLLYPCSAEMAKTNPTMGPRTKTKIWSPTPVTSVVQTFSLTKVTYLFTG